MQINLSELFPELEEQLDPANFELTLSDLEGNSFFVDLVEQMIDDYTQLGKNNSKSNHRAIDKQLQLKDIRQFSQIKTTIGKLAPKIIPIKVPKGTVIYTVSMPPDYGYFILHGCIELLSKKNTWEKLQPFQGHTVYKQEKRAEYLQEKYNIDPKHFHRLENIFFEENLLFNYLPFSKLYSKGYFGFKEMTGGCLRMKTAIAVEESLLLKVKKQDFDKYLKEFEQKRQKYIISNMLATMRGQIVQEILPKLYGIFNSSQIITYDKGQSIIKQQEFSNCLYFLIAGEVAVSKDVKIEVPKKYLSNENKGQFIKEVKVNLHKIMKNAFFGQIEPLLSKKRRQFSFQSIINNTILLKLDSHIFTKVIGQSTAYERELTISAKYKYSNAMETFLTQKNSIIKSYFNQVEQLDHRKKEKNVVNLLKNQTNFKQNELYQVFQRQGAFFRDSFERLQGFQQFQSHYDPKRSSIHRHKVKSSQQLLTAPQKRSKKKDKNQTSNQTDLSFEAMKKTLMSPVKSSNPFQIYSSDMKSKLLPVSQQADQSNRSTLRKKKRIVSKFQELKKDEAIFKRVLIKNGEYDINRQTNKSNRIEAIVNHQFDNIIKQCMTRKSVGVRRALMDHRQDIIKQEFMRTVSTLPNRSMSSCLLQKSKLAFTCKGTEDMRKRLERFKYMRAPTSTITQKSADPVKLEECIGFNKKPMSSEIKQRSAFGSPVKNGNRSPSKIVLLNHMMKPITYASSQL